MDISSALKNEIFRPLTTIVVPGAFAVGPFVLITGYYVAPLHSFWVTNPNAFVSALSIVVIAAGLILEDIGSGIEVIWDKCLKGTMPDREATWNKYLKMKITDEFVGQRYLRTIMIRFKFELSMAPALLVFLLGLLWVNALYGMWNAAAMSFVSLLVSALSAFLFWESYDSSRLLGKIHQALVDANIEPVKSSN